MSTRRTLNSRDTREGQTLHGVVSTDAKGVAQGADTTLAAAVGETAWDPYQVWLTRVQQPRERIARMRSQQRRKVEQPAKEYPAKPADPTLA